MSLIYLVRHGQASFGRATYDKLSELGEHQAVVLGKAMAGRGVRPRLMVTGGLQRQRITGSRMWQTAEWDAAVDVDAGWNEYDHDAIITAYRPAYRNSAVMRADLARHRHPRRAFQEMFVAASARWTSGEHDDDYPETFDAFRDRVTLALGRVATRLERGSDAVVVTSGGPMSWVAASLLTQQAAPAGAGAAAGASTTNGRALTLPAGLAPGAREVWLNLNRVAVNTAVTTLVQGTSLTLLDVNGHAHLRGDGLDPGLVTYR